MDPGRGVELVRGKQCVAVGAEAIERDVAEVEQTRPADRDVQPDGQDREQQRVDPDLQLEVVGGQQRDACSREPCRQQDHPPGDALEQALGLTQATGRVLAAAGGARDPLVDADARTLRGFGLRGLLLGAHRLRGVYTFWSGARPSSPCGRRIITTIRSPNTIRFVYVDEM